MPGVRSVSVGGRSPSSSGREGPEHHPAQHVALPEDGQDQVPQPGEAGHGDHARAASFPPAPAARGAFWVIGQRPVLHPGHGCGAARAPVGEGEDVPAEVAVADLDVGELVALLVEDLDPQLVELDEALHQLGEGVGSRACPPASAAARAPTPGAGRAGRGLSGPARGRRCRRCRSPRASSAGQPLGDLGPGGVHAGEDLSFRNSSSPSPMFRLRPACSSILR